MKHGLPSRPLPDDAIKLLTQKRTRDILEAATVAPRTAKEIADALNENLEPVWHHLRAMVRAELLAEGGVRKRPGRPQKLYQATTREFFVAAEARRTTVGRELSRTLDDRLESSDQAIGKRFFYDGCRWRVEKTYDPLTRPEDKQHEFWLVARLTAAQRERLYDDVRKLMEQYNSDQPPTGRRAMVRFACVSLPEARV